MHEGGSVWPNPFLGSGADSGWQGPSEDRDTQPPPGDWPLGDREHTAIRPQGQDRKHGGHTGHRAQPARKLHRGAPTGDSRSEVRAAWARPPHPGRELEGTAGRRAEGKRAGDVTSADQAPTPTRLQGEMLFPTVTKDPLCWKEEGEPRSTLLWGSVLTPCSRGQSLKTQGSPTEPTPLGAHPHPGHARGEACGDRMGHGTPRSVPRPHLPTGLTS